MQGEMVIYQGKAFPKEQFRVFVYSKDGSQKLVESWEEYQSHVETGAWFSTKRDAEQHTKRKRAKNADS